MNARIRPWTESQVPLTFTRIAAQLQKALSGRRGTVDAVVAIGRGGTVPGALAAFHLGVPLRMLRLNYRDDENTPVRAAPEIAGDLPDVRGLRVLLVDDVSVTGATLRAASDLLNDCEIVTLVMKGKPGAADVVVFSDIPECVRWPWHDDVDDRGTRG